MEIAKTILMCVMVVSSLFMILLILLHKAKGGGLSDMFGGGIQSSMGASYIAERNLNRITVIIAVCWILAIILVGFVSRY
jgi:preprotein translocase subunit SecG